MQWDVLPSSLDMSSALPLPRGTIGFRSTQFYTAFIRADSAFQGLGQEEQTPNARVLGYDRLQLDPVLINDQREFIERCAPPTPCLPRMLWNYLLTESISVSISKTQRRRESLAMSTDSLVGGLNANSACIELT